MNLKQVNLWEHGNRPHYKSEALISPEAVAAVIQTGNTHVTVILVSGAELKVRGTLAEIIALLRSKEPEHA